ncbi:DUF1624 domain-containing protein [Methylobacterium sp. BTF04]|uniref:heparan-alpha-glucosaminide N-acetyltransferase n=1 Tax=Methylobacterium sp. BTF04 TaxID=2708300 RepID=UPI0013D0B956|nr:heparan-alpha-glucosaminide N-acetyltransferase [Methylobacterium sp. BTF04]NEU12208.1 DUF1624 domain-containing protein [Methylobacterium sp. BTF04]
MATQLLLPTHRLSPIRPRFDAIDAVRGIALLAMASYHATWDLGYLRLTPESYALTPAGKAAAYGIAGTFLVLVGIGLVLMNGSGLRTRAYLLRLARIGGAALLITVATLFAFPQSYIFFGILHCIALSSVLALPFLRLPIGVTAVVAASVLALPHFVSGAGILDAPGLRFLGLGVTPPQTNDYVPVFPWFGFVLVGVALARFALPRFAGSRIAAWQPTRWPGRLAAFAGRHSLAVYLIHQPVLLALLTGLVALTGPHPRAGFSDFRKDYVASCARTGGEVHACRIAARCVAQAFRREGLWADAPRSFTVVERVKAQSLSQACYDAAEGSAPPP